MAITRRPNKNDVKPAVESPSCHAEPIVEAVRPKSSAATSSHGRGRAGAWRSSVGVLAVLTPCCVLPFRDPDAFTHIQTVKPQPSRAIISSPGFESDAMLP